MDKKYWIKHREMVGQAMEDNSLLVAYSGIPLHTNEDDYHDFEVNSQYFYLTGLTRENQILLMTKLGGKVVSQLFIEEKDDFMERWTGRMPSPEDVAEISGIDVDNVHYLEEFEDGIANLVAFRNAQNAYFDTFRCGAKDLDDYNLAQAKKFAAAYPTIRMYDLHRLVAPLRNCKDAGEIEEIKGAIAITENGLKQVMSRLKPGMMEYQAQAVFEGSCHYDGATRLAFATISAAGKNACSMHYGTNREEIRDGDLLLMDLGAKYHNYCSDITRTFPANGHYSDRQREVYNVVLKANRKIVETAKPGMTLRELNEVAKKILGEGMIELGLIDDVKDVGRYYMHSVSHSIGIDTHDIDVNVGQTPIQAGWIISDEPGIYIDEEGIGIRIEDDLLITEDGCICLSESIIRGAEEIEAFMAANRK